MSADILKSHEQQFGVLCADITTKIAKYCQSSDSSATKPKDDRANIEGLFQEANELIEQMELEIRDINLKHNTTQEQKQKYSNIIKSYKNELKKLENEFKRRASSLKARSDLFLTEQNDNDLEKIQLDNEEKLMSMNNKLESGYKITLESEEIGRSEFKHVILMVRFYHQFIPFLGRQSDPKRPK
jgi:hypothetical protein